MNLTDGQLRHRLSTSAVLEFAWDAGAFRADHVMAALGLTRSTALAALGTLIELGLIGDPGETGALVTTDAGKATVKARR